MLIEAIVQPIMIYGRMQQQADQEEKVWEYVAYVFFNHEQIKQVIFKGFESEGEKLMKEKLLLLTQGTHHDGDHLQQNTKLTMREHNKTC